MLSQEPDKMRPALFIYAERKIEDVSHKPCHGPMFPNPRKQETESQNNGL